MVGAIAHFGPEKEQYNKEMADFEEEIWKRKAIMGIGFIVLIIGLGLQQVENIL